MCDIDLIPGADNINRPNFGKQLAKAIIKDRDFEIEQLKAQVAVLMSVLQEYAKKENWGTVTQAIPNKDWWMKGDGYSLASEALNNLPEAATRHLERVKKMEEELRFYADPENYIERLTDSIDTKKGAYITESPISYDNGERATEALKDV